MSKQDATNFPDDENGRILRMFVEKGDDLSQPRDVEFNLTFAVRSDAIEFISFLEDKSLVIRLGWFEEAEAWDVTVTAFMPPSYENVTHMERELGAVAARYRGASDGWGCMGAPSKT